MKDKLVTVFGGSGFIGRYAVEALLRAGARVRVAERNPKQAWKLKALANLGQVQMGAADITKPETLGAAIKGADAVVNLVGSFADMNAIQHVGAANVARAAAANGVGALVHVSAIGADAQSASAYGRSKGEGEQAVHAAFPAATILRPSIVFGREDQFLNRFAALIKLAPVMPVLASKTRFQPVFAGDVGRAIAAALENPEATGQSYELGGPEAISMLALHNWLAKAIGVERLFIEVPDVVGSAMATLTGWLPGAPITRDQWLMLQKDNVVGAGAKGLANLGIDPTPMELVAPDYLVQYRKHGRFATRAAA
jgi:uncharacterized protein YbjT (DUF2867 family)